MAQKIFPLPGVGEVSIVKRRGAKNLRVSLTAAGRIRVSQPAWLPYSAGLQFAISKRTWINQHQETRQINVLNEGDRIGKSFRIKFKPSTSRTTTRLGSGEVIVSSHLPYQQPSVQAAAKKAAERALKADAERLLTVRVAELAKRHDYSYKELRIKKLTSRWGSCNSDGKIILSIFLIQLPWNLIDYVILHELAHTRHLNHGRAFWDQLKLTASSALTLRKQLKNYQPIIIPVR